MKGPKETAWEAWLESYKVSRNRREMSAFQKRAARSQFERWWDTTYK